MSEVPTVAPQRSKISYVIAAAALIAVICVGVPWVRLGQKGKSTKTTAARYLYVWDSSIPADVERTQKLLGFLQDEEITGLFVEASPVGYDQPGAVEDYSAFVDTMHAVGVRVFALGGHGWWAVPCDAGVPDQPTCFDEGWNFYANVAASGVPFDGIIDDSEPHGTNHANGNWFWDTLPQSAQAYVDFLRGARERIGNMTLIAATPFWFDSDERLTLALDGQASARPLNEYVAEIVDVVQVMSYRDYAEGPGGILDVASGELDTGPTIIAVETADLGLAGDTTTFYEEGRAYLDDELGKLSRALRRNPNNRGAAIHFYASFRELR